MARAVIGGLITSTLLTPIVAPVVYTCLDDLGAHVAGWWRRNATAHARIEEGVGDVAEPGSRRHVGPPTSLI